VGADWAVSKSFQLAFYKCFHGEPLISSDAELRARVVPFP
jgi:hypothetical protein